MSIRTKKRPTGQRLLVTEFLALTASLSVSSLVAQATTAHPAGASTDSAFRRRFVGFSRFVLRSLFPAGPSFHHLNLGYRLTRKDAISLETIT